MEFTQQGMEILYRDVQTTFQWAVQNTKPWTVEEGIVQVVPMVTLEMDQFWLARIPAYRRWVDSKHVNNLSAHSKKLIAAEWEDTIGIKRKFIKYDRFEVFNQGIVLLGQRGSKLIDYAFQDLLRTNPILGNDNLPLYYDGQPFFSTQHPTTGGDITVQLPTNVPAVQSNLALGTPLTHDNFSTAVSTMMSYTDETGRPFDVVPDTLYVGTPLRRVALEIADVSSKIIANVAAAAGSSTVMVQDNVEAGRVKVVVKPEMNFSPGQWLLAQTKRGVGSVAPFVYGELEKPHIIPMIDPQSANVFMHGEYLWSGEAMGEITGSLWYLCFMGNSAETYGAYD